MRSLLLALIACVASSNKIGKVYGFTVIKSGVGIVTIDPVSGAVSKTATALLDEATAQDLTAMDHARGIAYIIGYNQTVGYPNLIGIDVTTSDVVLDLKLPFNELAFVGIGQALDVDPASGDIIVAGQVEADDFHHKVMRVSYATKALTTVATLKADATHIALLGAQASTLDPAGMRWFLTLPVNNTAAPKAQQVEVHTFVVNLKTSAVTHHKMDISSGQVISSMDWDSKTKQILGFGPSEEAVAIYAASTRKSGFASVQEMFDFMRGRNAFAGASYVHTLAAMNPTTFQVTVKGKFTGYGLQEANIAALDPVGRVFMGLMQKAMPPPAAWEPATNCGACGNGTLCCKDPTQGAGACYKVGACSDIHDGSGINTTAPIHLVQMHLDSFKMLKSPSVCTMAANDCPWSLDVADGKITACTDNEYCCPDAKKCLTPTATSCAKDATACADGEVCCPLTKICVKPGKSCESPCAAKDYCCPDAKRCLALTNPGVFCKATSDCGSQQICCPLTKLCVSVGTPCVPP